MNYKKVYDLRGNPIIDVEIEAVDRHRNGISGEPFHVVTFRSREQNGQFEPMVGIVFDEPMYVAVFNRTLLGEGTIKFGINSFRGDIFEEALREAIKDHMRLQDTEWGKTQGPKDES